MKKKSKIKDQKSKLYKDARNSAGFTLVEILVVMIVLIFLGAIIGSIIMSVLRGTNKTNTLTMVRQNGSYAISQISKMLRNAKNFEGVSIDGAGGSYITNCVSSTEYKYMKIKSFDEGVTTFSCAGSPLKISSGSAELLDTSAVIVDECYFRCTVSGVSDYPRIDIYFSLRANSSSLLPERKASESAILFNTTVNLRNVGK